MERLSRTDCPPALHGLFERDDLARNENNETKAQAIQRFLMYATDELHDLGVYVGADVFGADLGAFAAVFRENPDYRRLLTEPSIPKAEREALLDEAWKDALHPYTLNFVKLLCANGTVSQLPDCETVYRARYNEDNNILAVTAVSAAPMREELQEKLRQKLEAKTGKHVELTVKVEPDLIGGVKLTIGGVQYDGTVRHHLDELQRILQTNSN